MKAYLCAALLVAAMGVPAAGQEAGRYVLKDVRDGFIRLDSRTGAISHCRPKNAQWTCESLADDRQVLQEEIAALEAENEALRKRLGKLEGVKRPKLELPSGPDLDRFMSFLDRVMQRLMEFAKGLDTPPGQET